jgi:hypothetical protein
MDGLCLLGESGAMGRGRAGFGDRRSDEENSRGQVITKKVFLSGEFLSFSESSSNACKH